MNADRLSGWFPLLLLAALAGLTFWLDQAVRLPIVNGSREAHHDPDYIIDGLTGAKMNPSGKVAYTLSAERMTHYPDDERTQLSNPKWVSLGQGDAPVTITARQALVSANGDNVYFEDEVRVVRAASGTHSELVLETNFLHVIPDEHIARTDRPVKITDANTVVTAVGLELNSETRVLKLLSTVKGVYHDPDRAPRGR